MFRIRKKFTFEAAHQLSHALSKACVDCIHGHSYTVELFLDSPDLDEARMIMDFGLLKDFIRDIKKEWDHALILPPKLYEKYRTDQNKEAPLKKLVTLGWNPTAETMAFVIYKGLKRFLEQSCLLTGTGARVEKVRVHETASGWAEFERD